MPVVEMAILLRGMAKILTQKTNVSTKALLNKPIGGNIIGYDTSTGRTVRADTNKQLLASANLKKEEIYTGYFKKNVVGYTTKDLKNRGEGGV